MSQRRLVLDLIDTSGNVVTTILVPSFWSDASWDFRAAPIMLGRIVMRPSKNSEDGV